MFAVFLHSGVQYLLAFCTLTVRYSVPQTSQILGSTVFRLRLYSVVLPRLSRL